MKLITKELPNNHNIFLFGDVHDGSVLSSQKGFKVLVDLMQSKYDGCSNNYGADGGDAIEAIMIDDRRFDPEKRDEPLPLEQMKFALKKREPIKDMLLYLLTGNHERALAKYGNLTASLAEDLGTIWGTVTAKLTVNDSKGNLMYKMSDTHGRKSITSTADDPLRRQTNKQLILKRHLKDKFGDCAVMIKHHTHQLIVTKPKQELYLTDNGKHITQQYTSGSQTGDYIHPDARWYGNAGSFLRLYGENMSGYAEIAEYDPVELGFLILKVRNKKIVELEPYYLKI